MRLRFAENDITGNLVTIDIGLVQADVHGIHRDGIDFGHAAARHGTGNDCFFDLLVQRNGDGGAVIDYGVGRRAARIGQW